MNVCGYPMENHICQACKNGWVICGVCDSYGPPHPSGLCNGCRDCTLEKEMYEWERGHIPNDDKSKEKCIDCVFHSSGPGQMPCDYCLIRFPNASAKTHTNCFTPKLTDPDVYRI